MNNKSTNGSQRCLTSQIGRVGNLRDIAVPQGSVTALSYTNYRWNTKFTISRQRKVKSIFLKERTEMSSLGTFMQNFSQIGPKLAEDGDEAHI